MKQHRIHIRWYILADILICLVTWLSFYYLRTQFYTYPFSMPPGFYLGLGLYTAGWLFLHFLTGTYKPLYEKSRLGEMIRTSLVILSGCLVLLFVFILKNPQEHNRNYYLEFASLLIPLWTLTITTRMLFLGIAKKQLRQKKVFFNAVLIGSGKRAEQFYHDFMHAREHSGFRIIAFFNINGSQPSTLNNILQSFNGLDALPDFISSEQVEEVIIAIDKNERGLITNVLQQLSDREVNIKIMPDTVDIITGALHTNNVLGIPLIDIHSGMLPDWQQNIKRVIDIVVSLTGLIILSPLLLYTMIRVALSSKGTVIFKQERIGFKGRPFTMYKFRSMMMDAEKEGPRLSHEEDKRITGWGKTMRKWRLDELPQLWNILVGEMSLVGPRPERKYYIDQIVIQHPEYKYLFKVKPGLTSWGMVKFGYASSVEEMVQRMPFDLLYVENVSLALDFKIMFYSIQIILAGKGK